MKKTLLAAGLADQQENPKQILKKDKKLTPFAISLYLCC